jgi:plastocyanin
VQGSEAPVFTTLIVSPASPGVTVGGTVTLVATPRDQNGSAMAGLPAATWTTSSDAVARVASGGVVSGVGAGTATITASVTSAGVTRTGTATVTVAAPSASSVTVTTPSLTFAPQTVTVAPGSTVTWQMSGSTHNVTFGALAPAGGSIGDTDEGNAVSRTFTAPGTYDYRCTRHDGMTGRVIVSGDGTGTGGGDTGGGTTPPAATVRTTATAFTPEEVTVAPGSTVRWEIAGATHNITFEDDAPPGGNVPDTPAGASVTRTFPSAGSYDYECTLHPGMRGRIRVR